MTHEDSPRIRPTFLRGRGSPAFLRGLFTVAAGVSFLLFVLFLLMWCYSYQTADGYEVRSTRKWISRPTQNTIEAPFWLDGWTDDHPPPYIFISLGFTCFCLAVLPSIWLLVTLRRWALSPPKVRRRAQGFPVITRE